jgi:ABC-type Zn2+ transport system substrate-binding protein/surface adhesin
VLKKVAIVSATTAAALLAISPLAFAGDYDGGHDHHGGHHHGGHDGDHGGHGHDHGGDWNRGGDHGDRNTQNGLVNLQNIGVQVPVQACNNDILSGVLGVLASHQRNDDRHDGSCGLNNH